MTPEERRDRAAAIVVEATVAGDKATCSKYGINRRTLQRYRKAVELGTDEKLSQQIAAKRAKVEEGWADEIPGALRAAVTFLRRAAEEANPKDPASVHAVAGAMKLLSETSMHWKVLDVRLARQNRPVPEAAGSNPGRPVQPATVSN